MAQPQLRSAWTALFSKMSQMIQASWIQLQALSMSAAVGRTFDFSGRRAQLTLKYTFFATMRLQQPSIFRCR